MTDASVARAIDPLAPGGMVLVTGAGKTAVMSAVLRDVGGKARAEDIAALLADHDIPAVSVGHFVASSPARTQ